MHVLKGPHPIMVAYTLAMLVALLWTRDAFTARPDSGSLLTRGALRARATSLLAFGFGVDHAAARAGARVEQLTVGGVMQRSPPG